MKVPVEGVLHAHAQAVRLDGGLHGQGVQHGGSEEGQLGGFLVGQQGHRPGAVHDAWIACQHACAAMELVSLGCAGLRPIRAVHGILHHGRADRGLLHCSPPHWLTGGCSTENKQVGGCF